MEQEQFFYDGRDQINSQNEQESTDSKPFQLTDEMRKNISGNPYIIK